MIRVTLATVLLALASQAIAQRTSNPVVLQQAVFQGSIFRLLSESSWQDAQLAAMAMGGHLATVEDESENAFLLSTFSARVLGEAPSGKVAMWIGLNDAGVEGSFQWVSGSSATYRNWNPGQPESTWPDEDFVGILVSGLGTPGRWHDVVLDTRFDDRTFGIVESPVPEPSTALLLVAGVGSLAAYVRRVSRRGTRSRRSQDCKQ